LLLRSPSPAPPSRSDNIWNGVRFNPKDIDIFHSNSDGVWWPDQLVLSMGWQGSSCAADRLPSSGFFNPFAAVPNSLVVEGFTEQLGEHDDAAAVLQWAMPQYGSVAATAAERGNLGPCRQEAGASSMSQKVSGVATAATATAAATAATAATTATAAVATCLHAESGMLGCLTNSCYTCANTSMLTVLHTYALCKLLLLLLLPHFCPQSQACWAASPSAATCI
jgi:hypothetical protein